MKRALKDARIVLRYLAVGFFGIIVLCWLDEYLGLTHLLFGGAKVSPNWREALFETGFGLTIWAITRHYITKLLERLYYLERFVRVCAWCRRISYGEEWVPFERFLELDSDRKTSHGVCPDCEARLVAHRPAEAVGGLRP